MFWIGLERRLFNLCEFFGIFLVLLFFDKLVREIFWWFFFIVYNNVLNKEII